MVFSNELIEKARNASSAEELLEMAKANGIELSAAEAETYFSFLTKKDEALSDDELEQVSGGKGGNKTPEPRYHAGQVLWIGFDATLCYVKHTVDSAEFYKEGSGWRYLLTDEFGFQVNYYLETKKYVHDFKPDSWIDKQ